MLLDFYPNILHGTSLKALRKRLNERETSRVPTEKFIKMADFVLKNNFFEFNREVKKQKSRTAIGTKFASPYAYIFMDAVETEFFMSQYLQRFLWLLY